MIDYSSLLSEKVQEIKPSGIRKFSELAAEMGNVISLGVGEPDFQTPWAIRQAGIETLERGRRSTAISSAAWDFPIPKRRPWSPSAVLRPST